MKNKKHRISLFIALILMLSNCISDFEVPGDLKDMSDVLVVEGVILEEGTRIFLSRTVKLNETLTQSYLFENVNNASISIIDEGANVMAVAEQYEWGRYVVKEKFSFAPNMKYALDIRVAGKHYRSAFSTPLNTPGIDEISRQINDDNSIDIMVTTHEPNNETLYCLWSFEENWEVRSRYNTLLRYDFQADEVLPQRLNGDNRYYCWASDLSKSLLLASSEKYRDAVIKDHKIHTLQPGNSRYSYLYSINVSQYRIDKEASLYFNNLQRNIDESGSLFAPQPSEITGNIQCLTDPDEIVVGYIFASKPATSRLFIPMAELNLNILEDRSECIEGGQQPDPRTAYIWGYGIYDVDERGNYLYISRRCVDCTQRGLGNPTKNKPAFWPNDHQ